MKKGKEGKAGKPDSYEELMTELTALKAEKKDVLGEIGAIRLKNHIKKGESPKDKKILKEWNELHAKKEKLAEKIAGIEGKAKELKPKKERVTKYNYPADCTTPEQKKNFRSKMRAAGKKSEDEPTKKKKDKKADKKKGSDKEVKASKGKEKSSKKSKKDKKAKKVGNSED